MCVCGYGETIGDVRRRSFGGIKKEVNQFKLNEILKAINKID